MNSASNFYKKLKNSLNEISQKTSQKKASFKVYIENNAKNATSKFQKINDPIKDTQNAKNAQNTEIGNRTNNLNHNFKSHNFDESEITNSNPQIPQTSEELQTQQSEISGSINSTNSINSINQDNLNLDKNKKSMRGKFGTFGTYREADDVDLPDASIATIGTTGISPSSTSQVKVSRTVNNAPKRIYADYASLTPIDPRVKKVMIDAMDEFSANPSSLYSEGVKAKQEIERSRTSIAAFFAVQPSEIIFTSGGTESNNLAFKGVIEACEKEIREVGGDISTKPHIIISTIEHPSIIEIALDLINKGYNVSFIPVDKDGIVSPKDIRKALTPETILVSVMYANNEIGTIQPIKEITREVRHYKKSLGRSNGDYPYVHTDACQAVMYEDVRVPGLNIDMVTVDGGKIYGPRSCGILIKRNYVKMSPIINGGNHEHGLRAGTENVYSIVGLKHALDIVHNEKEDEAPRLRSLTETLRETILGRLIDTLPGITINGDIDNRLPNNLNICFPGLDAEFLVIRLDVLGVMLSSVTSCRANNEDSSSYVIEALGKSDCSTSSLRISLGRNSTALDVAHISERIIQAVEEQINK